MIQNILHKRTERVTIDNIVMSADPNIMSIEEQMARKGGIVVTTLVLGGLKVAVTWSAIKKSAAVVTLVKGVYYLGKSSGGGDTIIVQGDMIIVKGNKYIFNNGSATPVPEDCGYGGSGYGGSGYGGYDSYCPCFDQDYTYDLHCLC